MLGIFGGTFDPVHVGHLRLALELRERLHLERVLLEVAAYPPHRDPPKASPEARLQMVRIAVEGIAGVEADDLEFQRPGPSYMVDTLQQLREREGEDALVLIMGMDAFAGLSHWHQWERVLDLCHLIVVERPGSTDLAGTTEGECLRDRELPDIQQLRTHKTGGILRVDPPGLEISASAIREALSKGQSIQYLVPDQVASYITNQGLYGSVRHG